MSTSSLPSILDALRTALAAYTGLSGVVTVWTAPIGNATGENIILGCEEAVVTEEPAGIGEDERWETITIPCALWVTVPNDTETQIKACRDRVYLLFGYVESYFNDATPQTITSTCRDAQIIQHKLVQGPYSGNYNGRFAEIDFTVEVEASKTP